MRELRERFLKESENPKNRVVLVTAVMLPTGAIETITNTHRLPEKIQYICDAYDDYFRLRSNPQVRIVGYMLV